MTARGFVYQILIGGGVLTGISGLVVAGKTMAEVETLTTERPAIVERLRKVESAVAALTVEVQMGSARSKDILDRLDDIHRELKRIE